MEKKILAVKKNSQLWTHFFPGSRAADFINEAKSPEPEQTNKSILGIFFVCCNNCISRLGFHKFCADPGNFVIGSVNHRIEVNSVITDSDAKPIRVPTKSSVLVYKK